MEGEEAARHDVSNTRKYFFDILSHITSSGTPMIISPMMRTTSGYNGTIKLHEARVLHYAVMNRKLNGWSNLMKNDEEGKSEWQKNESRIKILWTACSPFSYHFWPTRRLVSLAIRPTSHMSPLISRWRLWNCTQTLHEYDEVRGVGGGDSMLWGIICQVLKDTVSPGSESRGRQP